MTPSVFQGSQMVDKIEKAKPSSEKSMLASADDGGVHAVFTPTIERTTISDPMSGPPKGEEGKCRSPDPCHDQVMEGLLHKLN